MKNKYFIRSRISEAKFRGVIKLFSADLTATQIALLSKTNRKTINKIIKEVQKRIASFCEKKAVLKQVKLKWMKVILEPDEPEEKKAEELMCEVS